MRELVESIREICIQQKKALRESKMAEIDLEIGELRDEGMSDEEITKRLVAQYDMPYEYTKQMVAEKEIDEGSFNDDGSYNTSDDEANEFDEYEADQEVEESVSDSDKETMNIRAARGRKEVERTKAVTRQMSGEKGAKNVEQGFRSAIKRQYKQADVNESGFDDAMMAAIHHVEALLPLQALAKKNQPISSDYISQVVQNAADENNLTDQQRMSLEAIVRGNAKRLGATVQESSDVTDFNPKGKMTRKELLAKYSKTKDGVDATAARKAGASHGEMQQALAEEGKELTIKQVDGEWCVVDATGNIVDTATDKLGALQAARDLNNARGTNRRVVKGTRPADVEESVRRVTRKK